MQFLLLLIQFLVSIVAAKRLQYPPFPVIIYNDEIVTFPTNNPYPVTALPTTTERISTKATATTGRATPSVEQRFHELDTDGSGSLSQREVKIPWYEDILPFMKSRERRAFDFADRNRDGQLSLAEYRLYLLYLSFPTLPPRTRRTTISTPRSTTTPTTTTTTSSTTTVTLPTTSILPSYLEQQFLAFDEDRNGEISREELSFLYIPDLFEDSDTNHDGELNRKEFVDYLDVYGDVFPFKLTTKPRKTRSTTTVPTTTTSTTTTTTPTTTPKTTTTTATSPTTTKKDYYWLVFKFLDKDNNGRLSRKEAYAFWPEKLLVEKEFAFLISDRNWDLVLNLQEFRSFMKYLERRDDRSTRTSTPRTTTSTGSTTPVTTTTTTPTTTTTTTPTTTTTIPSTTTTPYYLEIAFRLFDQDGNGGISRKELGGAYLADLFARSDTNHDGELNRKEYTYYTRNWSLTTTTTTTPTTTTTTTTTPTTTSTVPESTTTTTKVPTTTRRTSFEERLFHFLDTDRSGGLSVVELKEFLRTATLHGVSIDTSLRLFKHYDHNNDRELNLQEHISFRKALLRLFRKQTPRIETTTTTTTTATTTTTTTTSTTTTPPPTTTKTSASAAEIKAVFDKTDKDKDGFASYPEIFEYFHVTGLHTDLIDRIVTGFQLADVQPRDGFLNLAEYRELYFKIFPPITLFRPFI